MNKSIFALFALAATVCSCEQNGTFSSEEESNLEKGVVSLVASASPFAENDSKSSLTEQGLFYWVVDDRIGFWPAEVKIGNPQQSCFYVTSHESSEGEEIQKSAAQLVASGWGLLEGRKYYSYYPYSDEAAYDGIRIDYTGQRQSADGSTSHLVAYDYMHATIETAESGSDIHFNHIGCQARFRVTVPADFANAEFKEFSISNASSIIVDSLVYNPLSDDEQGLEIKSRKTSRTFTVALDNIKPTLQSDGSYMLTVYAMMYPVAWNGKTINVGLTASDDTYLGGTFKPTKDQSSAKLLNYRACVATAPAPTAEDETRVYDSKIYTNLSKDGYANCYIVSAPGLYCFNASIRGNGVAPTGDSTPTANELSGRACQIWNNDGTAFSGEKLGTDGYVYFELEAGKNTCNTVISLMKDPSTAIGFVDGNCLWSWHIWYVGSPVASTTCGGVSVMDRNLGSTSYNSGGLIYQWGRKDPLDSQNNPGFKTIESSASVEISINYPIWMIYGTNGHHWESSTPARTDLWGQQKTMYDPCPAGWKVPDKAFSGAPDTYGWSITNVRGVDGTSALNSHGSQYWINEACWSEQLKGYVGYCVNVGGESSSVADVSFCMTANPIRCQKEQ